MQYFSHCDWLGRELRALCLDATVAPAHFNICDRVSLLFLY